MRLTVAIIFLLIVSACARNDRMSVIGNWESDISGVKFSVQIAKNLDAENDLLSAKVNGVTVNYAGSMNNKRFIGTGDDTPYFTARKKLFTLAEINNAGDLVCTMLNTSKIPHGTVLKREK